MGSAVLSAFRAKAESQADAPALILDGTLSWSYSQLAGRVDRWGQRLRRWGIGPGSLVGLNMEKSPEYIAAMFGVWAAGAAFMPMDPSLPPARLDYMARDAGVQCVLVAAGAAPSFPFASYGDFSSEPASLPFPSNRGCSLLAAHVAYVIYTSGSTGEPKGVVVGHAGLQSMLSAQIEAFGLGPGDRSLFCLSTQFDAAISDIGTALLSGAALCLEAAEHLLPGPGFHRLLRRRAITYADVPPAYLPFLEPDALPSSLHALAFGGEVADAAAVRRLARGRRLICLYGPTEATVCTSLCRCDPEGWDRPFLGDPLPGVAYAVRDEQARDLPPGTPGELHISGPCLALGYVNKPQLNAARFYVHQGVRWFRTRDRVVQHVDGLVFLGRLDRVFKLQGKLVAPEEVERNLLACPGVTRCAVLEDAGRLVACYTANAPLPVSDLRVFLAARLCSWLIPSRFFHLPDLPQTPTGKPDLNALRVRLPDLQARPESERGSPAFGDLDRLCRLWAGVLELPRVLPDDQFFTLGGCSLSAVLLAGRAATEGFTFSAADVLVSGSPRALLFREQTLQSELGMSAIDVADLAREVAGRAPQQVLCPRGAKGASGDGRILLTGVTGLLGGAVLAALLARGLGPVTCLVRAASQDAAMNRIDEALRFHGHPRLNRQVPQIQVLCGDLVQPFFGLPEQTYHRLACTHALVIHCAACINGLAPFPVLAPVNVDGTCRLAAFACCGIPKDFHFASSLSVLLASGLAGPILDEATPLNGLKALYGGYAQTKWVAESWLTQNFPGHLAVHRFGLLGPAPRGNWRAQDLVPLFLRMLARQSRLPPSLKAAEINLLAADRAAEAMVDLIMMRHCGTFHLAAADSIRLSHVVSLFGREGRAITFVPSLQAVPPSCQPLAGAPDVADVFHRVVYGDFRLRHPLNPLQTTGLSLFTQRTMAKLPRPERLRPPALAAAVARACAASVHLSGV